MGIKSYICRQITLNRMKSKRLHVIFVLLLVCVQAFPNLANNKSFTLVIDAGHGGNDAGAIGTYSKEKNINLNVALKVGELIQRNCPEVKVIFTRKTDVFVNLHERAAIANRAKADLFISIHTNAVSKGNTVVGSETYSLGMARSGDNLDVAKRENAVILYENDYQKRYAGFNPKSSESYIIFEFMQDQYMKQSAELAQFIQNEYTRASRPDKGVKQAGFLVLRETSMPSVLTELGFITTPSEEQYLNSAKGTDDLARSIYNGFVRYKDKVTRSHSVILNEADKKNIHLDTSSFSDKEDNTPVQTVENAAPQVNLTKEKDVQPEVKPKKEDTTVEAKAETKTETNDDDNATPVFKIQFLTSSRMLRQGSQQLKGLENVDNYLENNTYKYTYGSSSNYSEILSLKKTITDKFPDCFVIAMKGSKRISIQEAQNELKNKKK